MLSLDNTGIATVQNIFNGAGYLYNDVLSVDDATVGGGGSEFQFTVTKVGFYKQ